MGICDSRQWLEDIDAVADALPELRELAGGTIMVTGASGLVCSAVVDVLLRYNDCHDLPICVVAAGRDEGKMAERFRAFWGRPYLRFLPYDAQRGGNGLPERCDFVIHGAGNAFPGAIVREPAETMKSNFSGLAELLDHARTSHVRRVLYVSSSEVYGKKEDCRPFREEEYGYVDLLDPRSCYPVAKRAAETLCASYYAEYGVDSVIVRPGHVYGPTARPGDNRASSVFAYQVARGEDILMKSDGSQLRSYCYCPDCASAILKTLLRGGSVRAYNVSSPEMVISVREMAQLMAEAGGVQVIRGQADSAEQKSYNPMRTSALDGSRLAALGWKSVFSPREGIAHTVRILSGQCGTSEAL